MNEKSKLNRRDFVKTAVGAGMAIAGFGYWSLVAATLVAPACSTVCLWLATGWRPGVPRRIPGIRSTRIIGANDRIHAGVIGVGGRGTGLLREALRLQETENIQVLAVSDVYVKRKNRAQEMCKGEGYLDYRELLNRNDIDAVIVATPDHWHAKIASEAMERGKDVYLEKPMTHTVEEARDVHETVVKSKRVLQVGSQTTSSDQWWKARKAIQDGMIGRLIMSQGSYHRNSEKGEWNYVIDADAGPNASGDNYVDWKMWLGKAKDQPFFPQKFLDTSHIGSADSRYRGEHQRATKRFEKNSAQNF